MKIEISLENRFEKAVAGVVTASVLLLAVAAISSLIAGEAVAEWDSSSAFGDSYYLQEIADNIADCASELDNIDYTLGAIEDRL
jgi:hypothetical protein